MIISENARRASILTDEPTAEFDSTATREQSIAVTASESPARSSRATVEILLHAGGLMPRALVGGAFTPSTEPSLVIVVATSGLNLSGALTCASQLAKPLVPGLPDEFAASVVDGLMRRASQGGRIVVDRAAFDPVESSPFAFELAAELLAAALAAEALGMDVTSAARKAVEAWP